MKQKNRSVINIGTTSLVLIFAVLALVIFALLSYASAGAQWKLAEKMAERTTTYYGAEQQAVEMAQQKIEAQQEAKMVLQQEEKQQTAGQDAGEEMIEFQVPVGETQTLQVKIQRAEADRTGQWNVLEWRVVNREVDSQQQNRTLYGIQE